MQIEKCSPNLSWELLMVDLEKEKEIGLGNSFEYDKIEGDEILIDVKYKSAFNMSDNPIAIVNFNTYSYIKENLFRYNS